MVSYLESFMPRGDESPRPLLNIAHIAGWDETSGKARMTHPDEAMSPVLTPHATRRGLMSGVVLDGLENMRHARVARLVGTSPDEAGCLHTKFWVPKGGDVSDWTGLGSGTLRGACAPSQVPADKGRGSRLPPGPKVRYLGIGGAVTCRGCTQILRQLGSVGDRGTQADAELEVP